MKKLFKELKPGDTIFLVGNPEFIVHEDLPENFSLFIIENIIKTLDGKRVPIVCLSGKYLAAPDAEEGKKKVSYFTAPEDLEINGHKATLRVDEWSEIFTKTISKNLVFLCFQDIDSGLDFLKSRFEKYLEDIRESKEINQRAQEEKK